MLPLSVHLRHVRSICLRQDLSRPVEDGISVREGFQILPVEVQACGGDVLFEVCLRVVGLSPHMPEPHRRIVPKNPGRFTRKSPPRWNASTALFAPLLVVKAYPSLLSHLVTACDL